MNRLKVWLFTLLAVAVAGVTLRVHADRLRRGELAALDARLGAAAEQVSAATRALAREASAAAAFAAGDARLSAALAGKEAAPAPVPAPRVRRGAVAPAPPPAPAVDLEAQDAELRDAARAALAAAERSFGFELPSGTVVTAGDRASLARQGEAGAAEAGPLAFLRAAVEGEATRGFVRVDQAVFYAAAAPAGAGAGIVVVVPVDDAWARSAASAAGVDLTLSVPAAKPVSTARVEGWDASAGWSHGASAAVGLGRLGTVDLSVGPVALPKVPSLLGELPTRRARAIALAGLENGFAVVSLSAVRSLGQVVAFEWYALIGLAVTLLAGLVVGLLVRPAGDGPASLPAELLAAAARIEKGDFAARAPALAGKLGIVAAALNRAAELAGPSAAAATARPSATDEFFAAGLRPEPLRAPEAPSFAAPPADVDATPAAVPAPPPFADPFAGPDRFALAAPLDAAPEAPEALDLAPAPPLAPPPEVLSAPAALLQAAAQAAPPAPDSPEAEEEAHWKEIFEEFLRVRASCGEATQGLAYEKFRAKLEGNRATLVAKYACKAVRFQVYVKEGKAALKATPVK